MRGGEAVPGCALPVLQDLRGEAQPALAGVGQLRRRSELASGPAVLPVTRSGPGQSHPRLPPQSLIRLHHQTHVLPAQPLSLLDDRQRSPTALHVRTLAISRIWSTASLNRNLRLGPCSSISRKYHSASFTTTSTKAFALTFKARLWPALV